MESLIGSRPVKGTDILFRVSITAPNGSPLDLEDCTVTFDAKTQSSGTSKSLLIASLSTSNNSLNRTTNTATLQVIDGRIPGTSSSGATFPKGEVGVNFGLTITTQANTVFKIRKDNYKYTLVDYV